MGSTGAIIMSIFAGIFYLLALGPNLGWTHPLLLLPIAIIALIVARAVALSRKGSANLATERAEKVIMWSTIGEGIGILIVANILFYGGHRDLVLPGVAAVVGLHFLPMAYAIPFRAFYAVSAALEASAALGFLLPRPSGTEYSGVAAAAVLWIASFAALSRESRALARPSKAETA
jgi:hypothetical protein